MVSLFIRRIGGLEKINLSVHTLKKLTIKKARRA